MPPEGYTTLTVPDELAIRLDEYDPQMSTPATIRHLLDAEDDSGEREQTIDVEDSRLIAEHVERTLSPYFADLAGVDDASKIRDAADDNDVGDVTLEASERTKLVRAIADKLAEGRR